MVKAYITDKGHTTTLQRRTSAQRPLQSRRRRHRRRLLVVYQTAVCPGRRVCVWHATARVPRNPSNGRCISSRGHADQRQERKPVKNRKQAIAIGLSEARRKAPRSRERKPPSRPAWPGFQSPSSGLQIRCGHCSCQTSSYLSHQRPEESLQQAGPCEAANDVDRCLPQLCEAAGCWRRLAVGIYRSARDFRGLVC